MSNSYARKSNSHEDFHVYFHVGKKNRNDIIQEAKGSKKLRELKSHFVMMVEYNKVVIKKKKKRHAKTFLCLRRLHQGNH